jgi:hypothetical protein
MTRLKKNNIYILAKGRRDKNKGVEKSQLEPKHHATMHMRDTKWKMTAMRFQYRPGRLCLDEGWCHMHRSKGTRVAH